MNYTGTKGECENYVKKVNRDSNYGPVTLTWAEVLKNPLRNSYYVEIHEDFDETLVKMTKTEEGNIKTFRNAQT